MKPFAMLVSVPAALALAGCVGTTGGSLFTFDAAAAGPADAPGGTWTFTSGRGFDVELEHAKLHVGAVYLDSALPISGAGSTDCILPSVEGGLAYVGEVTAGEDVDLLDPAPQAFPVRGEGLGYEALAGEVWLTDGDVNATTSSTVVLYLHGEATQGSASYPFDASITIGDNWVPAVVNPAEPNANPVCKQRIVAPIPIHVPLTEGGAFVLRIDPRAIFANVDFSELPTPSGGGRYEFQNDVDSDPASLALYLGLHASDVYTFDWITTP